MRNDPLGQKIAHTFRVAAEQATARNRWHELQSIDNADSSFGRRANWPPLAVTMASFGVVAALVGGALFLLRSETSEPQQPVAPVISVTSSTTTAPTSMTTTSQPDSTTTTSGPASTTTTVDDGNGTSTTTTSTTLVPTSAPDWPADAPTQYLSIGDEGFDWWAAEELVERVLQPGTDRGFIIGDVVVFDTHATSDVYVFPEPAGSPVSLPNGAGGLLFSHFHETQIRIHEAAVIDGRATIFVEEIDEGNFGDELTSGDYGRVERRRLMAYEIESGDRTVVIDISARGSGDDIDTINGSVTHVSVGGDTVAVSFRTLEQAWIELFSLNGSRVSWSLPYEQPGNDSPLVLAALESRRADDCDSSQQPD